MTSGVGAGLGAEQRRNGNAMGELNTGREHVEPGVIQPSEGLL